MIQKIFVTIAAVLIKIYDADPYQFILLYGTPDRKVSLQQKSRWKRSVQYGFTGSWKENFFTENKSIAQ